jgi:WD40 repeat protein
MLLTIRSKILIVGICLTSVPGCHSQSVPTTFGEQVSFQHGGYPVESAAFAPNGAFLATSGGDNQILVWDLSSNKTTNTISGHRRSVISLAFSPDGRKIVSGAEDGVVRICDLDTGKSESLPKAHSDRVRSVAVSSDGALIASGGHDGVVRVWKLADRELAYEFKVDQQVEFVGFTPGGKTLVTITQIPGKVRLYGLESGELETCFNLGEHNFKSGVLNADGRLYTLDWMGNVREWDLKKGTSCDLYLGGRTIEPACFGVNSEGTFLAVGGFFGGLDNYSEVRVISISSKKEVFRTRAHVGSVAKILFSPNGASLVSVGEDDMVRLWEISKEVGKERK